MIAEVRQFGQAAVRVPGLNLTLVQVCAESSEASKHKQDRQTEEDDGIQPAQSEWERGHVF
jgi:hypothetical protein